MGGNSWPRVMLSTARPEPDHMPGMHCDDLQAFRSNRTQACRMATTPPMPFDSALHSPCRRSHTS